MLRLRVFEKSSVRVWLCDEGGRALRELGEIGGLSGKIDWRKSAESCRSIGEEGLEIDLVVNGG